MKGLNTWHAARSVPIPKRTGISSISEYRTMPSFDAGYQFVIYQTGIEATELFLGLIWTNYSRGKMPVCRGVVFLLAITFRRMLFWLLISVVVDRPKEVVEPDIFLFLWFDILDKPAKWECKAFSSKKILRLNSIAALSCSLILKCRVSLAEVRKPTKLSKVWFDFLKRVERDQMFTAPHIRNLIVS